MCGNVWEWTASRYKKDGEFHVVRGGSYNDGAEYLHAYYRLEAHPKDKCEAIGFRCVKNVHL
jgi:formylglycine-generating enzyme required for sulfatase activity